MKEETRVTGSKKIQDLSNILDISKAMMYEKNLDNLLEFIMEKTREIMLAERCTLFMWEEETQQLWSRIAQDIEIKEIRLPIGKGIAGSVARDKKIINIPDAYLDERFNKEIDKKTGFRTRAILCAPMLRRNGSILGVFQVINKAGGGIFTKYDEELLTAICSQAASAIENVLLYEEKEMTFKSFLRALSAAIDARDPVTAGHSDRVAKYALNIGKALALSNEELRLLEVSALLHDIGKIGIRDEILLKPGRFTPEEYDNIKQHAWLTREILGKMYFSIDLKDVPFVASSHHEKIDGSGYPLGLKGEQLSRLARILAIVDVYDALTSYDRPYKKAMMPDEALEILKKGKGGQYDSDILDLFIEKKLYLLERREYTRVNIDLGLEYKVIPKEDFYLKTGSDTKTINISGGGLLFKSSKLIPVGSYLDAIVHTPDAVLPLLAKVTRAEKQNDDEYNIGCKFLNLSEKVEQKLQNYLANISE